MESSENQLGRNGCDAIRGRASFKDATRWKSLEGETRVRGERMLIASGTRPAHSPNVPFDGKRDLRLRQLLDAARVYKDVIVVGAGVIGLEYASMFAALGIRVTLIEAAGDRPRVRGPRDRSRRSCYHLRQRGVAFRLGEKVERVGRRAGRVEAPLESGKEVARRALLYTVGRRANARPAETRAPSGSGRRARPDRRQRALPDRGAAHLRGRRRDRLPGAGLDLDGAGSPGRAATCSARPCEARPSSPYGIYTIPEISMVGKNEEQLTAERVPYEVGVAQYEELAKGQILGDETGMLKILFDRDDPQVLGVHMLGERRDRAHPHRPGRDGASAARSTTSATTSSTTPRSPRRTRSAAWTGSTGFSRRGRLAAQRAPTEGREEVCAAERARSGGVRRWFQPAAGRAGSRCAAGAGRGALKKFDSGTDTPSCSCCPSARTR